MVPASGPEAMARVSVAVSSPHGRRAVSERDVGMKAPLPVSASLGSKQAGSMLFKSRYILTVSCIGNILYRHRTILESKACFWENCTEKEWGGGRASSFGHYLQGGPTVQGTEPGAGGEAQQREDLVVILCSSSSSQLSHFL